MPSSTRLVGKVRGHDAQGFSEHRTASYGELPDDQFAWVLFATLRLSVPTRDGSSWLVRKLSDSSKFDNWSVTMSPDTKTMQSIRKSLAQQKKAAAVACACKANPNSKAKGKAKGKANAAPFSSGVLCVALVAAASLLEDMVGTIKQYMECLADTTSTSAELANKLTLLCVEFAVEGKLSWVARPALQVIRATSDVKLANLADPAEALCKLGNDTSHSVKVYTGWSFLRKYIQIFVSTPHTLKSQAGAAEEGGDPVLGASEVALCAVVVGMDCVLLQSACLRWKKRKIS